MRRNGLIARAILNADTDAHAMVVTGSPWRPPWLTHRNLTVVSIPPLLKHSRGGYRPIGMTFDAAVQARADAFARCVRRFRPHVVVVDRHPYGTAGELLDGLAAARAQGARLVLGLRDILDEPEIVRAELAGEGWTDVGDTYDEVLVYGAAHFCDHQTEYGLPVRPTYCGWVTEAAAPGRAKPALLAVTAGGGGDGDAVFRLALSVVARRPLWRAVVAIGPFADAAALLNRCAEVDVRDRIDIATETAGCGPLFARATAVIQMAGYNSTCEALAARQRAVLVPRHVPRREQAIRSERLAALDLVDVVHEDDDPGVVDTLLDKNRRLHSEQVRKSGIALDGATRTAAALAALADRVSA